MKVSIEEKSGFCFGVKRAIDMAEKMLDQGETVYCLGEIVHNEKEIRRLVGKGLIFIGHKDLENLRNKKVLIRAHGEPPETYETARKNKLTVIDGTCPIVLALQNNIRKRYEEMDKTEDQILIYGKNGHPEITGLVGQTGKNALVIRDPEELKKIELKKNIILYSQTTMDTGGFEQVSDVLRKKLNFEESGKVEINNSICSHISHREPGLRNFASRNEVLVFVAGLSSSNGRILYEICRSENAATYFISESDELNPVWFEKVRTVGVTGATSTPVWLLEEVAEVIRSYTIT